MKPPRKVPLRRELDKVTVKATVTVAPQPVWSLSRSPAAERPDPPRSGRCPALELDETPYGGQTPLVNSAWSSEARGGEDPPGSLLTEVGAVGDRPVVRVELVGVREEEVGYRCVDGWDAA
jgi:hypothetical protein